MPEATPASTSLPAAGALGDVQVAELWRRYHESGDAQAREQLVIAYSPLVKYAARQVRLHMPAHVDIADLVSYGLVGLVAAIDRFRPERETMFDSYAMVRIRGAILDELRVLDWVPRSVRAQAKEIDRATVKLRCTLQRNPEELELADELDLEVDELRRRLAEISNSGMAALDESWDIPGSPGDSAPRSALLADTEAVDPARLLEASELKDRVVGVIGRLPAREQLVVGLYYYENLTQREIADLLGLSKAAVSEAHMRAMQRLRSWIGNPAIGALVGD
jgi:RNA polymerase sigma factor for flagellar operon FliA